MSNRVAQVEDIEALILRARGQLLAARRAAGSDDAALVATLDALSAALKDCAPASPVARRHDRLAEVVAIVSELAHSFGNPLAGISVQAQLVLHLAGQDPTHPISDAAPPAQRIVAEAEAIGGELKNWAEFADSRRRMSLAPVELHDRLRQAVARWQPSTAARGIDLTLDLPPDAGLVNADADQLDWIFDELLQNSVEAIGDAAGHIDIRVLETIPETLTITVTDSGSGIAAGISPFRLFETTKPNRLGIGLTATRQIILRHGGHIEFAPAAPRGTVFRMELHRLRRPLVD
ncbi:MAG TPA: HAMP domain-containing sensor histidine kinase [Candidatus Binatia bacterium]|nr:HAMP domain-containing sensor histidine kinase [Candidatus Binatia bacterium]